MAAPGRRRNPGVGARLVRGARSGATLPHARAGVRDLAGGEVAASMGDVTTPLMEKREVKKRAVIVVSTDKGLCGGLNSNLMREAAKLDKNTTVFVTAGKKGSQFIARTKRGLAAEFTYKDAPLFAEARAISKTLSSCCT